MIAIYFILFVLFFLPASIISASEIKLKSENLIRSHFNNDITLEFQKIELKKSLTYDIEIEVGQKFFRNSLYTWKVFNKTELLGFAIIDNVIGKSLPITFLVIFDPHGNILSSNVVKYRESIGGEISNRRWNSQFKGKNYESSFTAGKDIDVISGATISVNAMTKGIRKLAILFELIREDL